MVEENPTDVKEYQAKRPLGVILLVIWAAINCCGAALMAIVWIHDLIILGYANTLCDILISLFLAMRTLVSGIAVYGLFKLEERGWICAVVLCVVSIIGGIGITTDGGPTGVIAITVSTLIILYLFSIKDVFIKSELPSTVLLDNLIVIIISLALVGVFLILCTICHYGL